MFVGVVCLPRGTDFSTAAKFEEHVREWRIMGVMSHHKPVNRQFVMGDVCRSRKASLSEHRSAYNGVKSVSEPFMIFYVRGWNVVTSEVTIPGFLCKCISPQLINQRMVPNWLSKSWCPTGYRSHGAQLVIEVMVPNWLSKSWCPTGVQNYPWLRAPKLSMVTRTQTIHGYAHLNYPWLQAS